MRIALVDMMFLSPRHLVLIADVAAAGLCRLDDWLRVCQTRA